MAEAERRKTDLIVIGRYSHLWLREWLLSGVIYNLQHEATCCAPDGSLIDFASGA